MTNEEAIYQLKEINKEAHIYSDAVEMAIEALKEQQEHSQNTSSKQPDLETLGIKTGETCEDVISRQDAIDAIKTSRYLVDAMEKIIRLPSVQSKQLQILANVLDGCPLTQPCDRMWRGGWCEEHCKNNKLQKPNAECWLKYAEVMAERKCDGKNQSDL